MRISKETIGLVAIATFCFLGLSLYLDIFYYTFDLNNTGDSLSYKEAAKMLFYGAKAHPTRPIGIAFFFGFLERIHPILITVVQFLLWIGTILVLNKSISLIANKRISFILCLIFILCFSHILYIHLELTETITTFLLTLTSYFILKYTKAHSFKNLAYASAILLFMVLIKPGFYYVSLILTLYTFWKLIRAKISLRIAIPILFALALLALNNAMVYKSYGKFKPSFIDDVTLYTYLGAYSETEVRNTSTARIQR